MHLSRPSARGFTLVELMIVVAIIGVLAGLAIYGVSRYVRHSKTAEANRLISHIETGSAVQYQLETPPGFDPTGATTFVHQFCQDAGPTPTAFPNGQKITPLDTEWISPGWRCLKQSGQGGLYYQYSYKSNGLFGVDAQYTVMAEGDLDGNGLHAKFILYGKGGPFGDAIRDHFDIINEDE